MNPRMRTSILLGLGFVLVIFGLATQIVPFVIPQPNCFEHVTVTGYYVPELTDYDPITTESIPVDGVPRSFNASFLREARIKGAGVSLRGTRLVLGSAGFRTQKEPLDPETGWFPEEKDFVTRVPITTAEDAKTRLLPKAFVDTVAMEGSGRIEKNIYLGRPFDDVWHVRPQALSAQGTEMKIGDVATDPNFTGHKVTITPTPPGFEHVSVFDAVDTGPAIIDHRIDIFSGFGSDGLERTMGLTGFYRVCFAH
jgi:hypothetical protein